MHLLYSIVIDATQNRITHPRLMCRFKGGFHASTVANRLDESSLSLSLSFLGFYIVEIAAASTTTNMHKHQTRLIPYTSHVHRPPSQT